MDVNPDRERAPRIAFFLATSGHSGVDRLMRNLLPAIARRGYAVDQLKISGHGPHIEAAEGLRVIELGGRHVWSGVPAVVRYLRQYRPQVLFSAKDRVNRAAIVSRWLARAPTALVLRLGTTVSVDLAHRARFDRWQQKTSMKYLYPAARAVLVPSRSVASDLVACTGIAPDRVRSVPSPVLPARLLANREARPPHPWFDPGQPPVILGAGELSLRKDFATLIRAFARVRQGRECRLVILGKGGQLEALRQLATALNVAGDVDFPGFRDDVLSFMTHCAAFVLCSRWEGMPVVLVEALSCGVPVVASDIPGARELLDGGRLGPLVPVGDDAALADALQRVLDAPPDGESCRSAARPYEIEAATTAYLAAMGLPAQAGGVP